MRLALIVAASLNGVIGKGNKLPWNLPNDLRRFKSLTEGNCVIMGRNTFASIGHPLPNRTNVILSSSHPETPGSPHSPVHWASSVDDALNYALSKHERVFIIGGASLYAQTLHYCDTVFLTRVHAHIEDGDAFFHFHPDPNFTLLHQEHHQQYPDHSHGFSFLTFQSNL